MVEMESGGNVPESVAFVSGGMECGGLHVCRLLRSSAVAADGVFLHPERFCRGILAVYAECRVHFRSLPDGFCRGSFFVPQRRACVLRSAADGIFLFFLRGVQRSGYRYSAVRGYFRISAASCGNILPGSLAVCGKADPVQAVGCALPDDRNGGTFSDSMRKGVAGNDQKREAGLSLRLAANDRSGASLSRYSLDSL